MSVQAISWVLDHSASTLGSRLVLIAIANHANRDGTGSWPSVSTIAREARLGRREVQYCLRDLESIGELKTTKGGGRGKSNLYSLPQMAQSLRGFRAERAQNRTQTAHPSAPEPSLKQPLKIERESISSSSVEKPDDDDLVLHPDLDSIFNSIDEHVAAARSILLREGVSEYVVDAGLQVIQERSDHSRTIPSSPEYFIAAFSRAMADPRDKAQYREASEAAREMRTKNAERSTGSGRD